MQGFHVGAILTMNATNSLMRSASPNPEVRREAHLAPDTEEGTLISWFAIASVGDGTGQSPQFPLVLSFQSKGLAFHNRCCDSVETAWHCRSAE